jgi:nucleoside 2-deoxyribosyltransferase
MDTPTPVRETKKSLYFAAALFCLREVGVNAVLVDKIE